MMSTARIAPFAGPLLAVSRRAASRLFASPRAAMALAAVLFVTAPELALLNAGLGGGGRVEAADATFKVVKRARVEKDGAYAIQEQAEQWTPAQTAIIVCDVWDSHHCLNAVRRVEEMAPRMNQVLEAARARGVLIVHAPSSCMERYEKHPGRARAKSAPAAANLPADIGQWCRHIPSEEKGKYPLDQTDGGEDDDPTEHRLWHERLAGMGRNPKSPWKAQIDVLRIDDQDAISDSGVEVWNLFEQRGIKNVVLLGVHTNMCVLGRPFGLRQMAKNGKNVVLMRDMTDTMYNPQRWPYVTHYMGNDLIVEHIEKFVCPTITSVDFIGGQPFRFKNDRRSVLMVIGEDEYKTNETLPAFADSDLRSRGFQVTIVHSDEKDPNNFPGLTEAAAKADVMLISVRRRTPPPDQLNAVRAHLAAGKPLVGIRTASHAFSLRNNMPPPEGRAAWLDFDPAVWGGRYVGHHGVGPKAALTLAPGAKEHALLAGLDLSKIVSNGSLYKAAPLEPSTTPLVLGTIPDQPTEPIAWTNTPRVGGGRVFYTSLGHPDDFQSAEFRKFLVHALCWTMELAPPGREP